MVRASRGGRLSIFSLPISGALERSTPISSGSSGRKHEKDHPGPLTLSFLHALRICHLQTARLAPCRYLFPPDHLRSRCAYRPHSGFPDGPFGPAHAILHFLHLSPGDHCDQSHCGLITPSVQGTGLGHVFPFSLFSVGLLHVCHHPFDLWSNHRTQPTGSPLLVPLSL